MRDLVLGLTLAEGVGWKTIDYLLKEGMDSSCFNLSPRQWQNAFPRLKGEQAQALSAALTKDGLREYKRYLDQKEIGYMSVFDEEYPLLLKEMHQPPWLLFFRGEQGLLNRPALAVVGTRKASAYGRSVTETMIPALSKAGLSIVSGMASGIDTLAHEGALQAKGATVAVLGSGIDVIYPPKNRRLYERLVQSGLVLSEYPPQRKPHPGYFPQRNRIIAGLSYGVLVVEAAQRSGSLITAQLALEHGREVFAVPGSIFHEQSLGTNQLIQQAGAKLVITAQDILEELAPLIPKLRLPGKGDQYENSGGLSEKEKRLLELMKGEKVHINELHYQTGWSLAEITGLLIKLEMKRKIVPLPGSFYRRLTPPVDG